VPSVEVTEPVVIWPTAAWAVLLVLIASSFSVFYFRYQACVPSRRNRRDQVPTICPEGRITYQ
jgi:hypothetical protein